MSDYIDKAEFEISFDSVIEQARNDAWRECVKIIKSSDFTDTNIRDLREFAKRIEKL